MSKEWIIGSIITLFYLIMGIVGYFIREKVKNIEDDGKSLEGDVKENSVNISKLFTKTAIQESEQKQFNKSIEEININYKEQSDKLETMNVILARIDEKLS